MTKLEVKEALSMQGSSTRGSNSEYHYATKSDVAIFDKAKKTKAYTQFADFNIQRQTLHVSAKGEMQFRLNTSDKKGNMNLNDMGFPEPNETLEEVVNSFGIPVVVKDQFVGSVFYLPRISLPQTKAKEGDKWSYKGRWISKDTGWPFEIEINSELLAWADCDGTLCAIIDFKAQVLLPNDFPLRSEIKSNITGRLHYSPHSFDILWGESQSEEVFSISELQKEIRVKSTSCSYKIGYSKACPKL